MAMASKQTSNYGLCQWEAMDRVLHTDFNEDNQKIDTALKNLQTAVNGKASSSTVSSLSSRVSNLESGKASVSDVDAVDQRIGNLSLACAMVASGTYVGTGTSGSSGATTLTFTGLNRTPLLVVVRPMTRADDGLVLVKGMTTCADSVGGDANQATAVTITSWAKNKITWYGSDQWCQMNTDGTTYCYFAVG